MRDNHSSGFVAGNMNSMTLQKLQQLQSNLQQQPQMGNNNSARRTQSESAAYTNKKRSLDFMSPTSKDIGSMVQRLSSMPESSRDMLPDPFEPTPLAPTNAMAQKPTRLFRLSSAPAAPNHSQSMMPTNYSNPAEEEEEDPFEPLDPNADCKLDAFVESASLLDWLDEDGSIKSTKKRCTSFSGTTSSLMQPSGQPQHQGNGDNRNMGQILEILQQQQRETQQQQQQKQQAKLLLQLEQQKQRRSSLEQLHQKQLQEVQERKQKLQQEQKQLLLRKLQQQRLHKQNPMSNHRTQPEMKINADNFLQYEVRKKEESPTFSTLNKKQENNGMQVQHHSHQGGRLNDSMDQSAKTEFMLQNLFNLDSKPTTVTPEPYVI